MHEHQDFAMRPVRPMARDQKESLTFCLYRTVVEVVAQIERQFVLSPQRKIGVPWRFRVY